MKNSPLKICNETIYPKERLSLALPLPELFSCAPIYMPIKVFHGKKAGPCLLIVSGICGDELNGMETINRLMEQPWLERIAGTLIAVPVFDVYGFMNKTSHLPIDLNIENSFPGSEHGSHSARFAHVFTQNILSLANYCVHLRSGPLNHTNFPQVYVDLKHAEAKKLAYSFAAPIISKVRTGKNSFREAANALNIPLLVYEAGEALRFDEDAIKGGLRGVANVMRELGMLQKPSTSGFKKTCKPIVSAEGMWVRAESSGISHSKIRLGQQISEGDLLCVIKDPFGAGPDRQLFSPIDGVVVGINNLPLVHEGEVIFKVAAFAEDEEAVSRLEDWQSHNTENAPTPAKHEESENEPN